MAFIYALIFSGIYTINYSLFDVGLVLAAGTAGLVMRILGLPLLPAVLGVVLGFLVESNYRRSLVLSGGEHFDFSRRSSRRGSLVARRAVYYRFFGYPNLVESGPQRRRLLMRVEE